jgi:hypothetical protein
VPPGCEEKAAGHSKVIWRTSTNSRSVQPPLGLFLQFGPILYGGGVRVIARERESGWFWIHPLWGGTIHSHFSDTPNTPHCSCKKPFLLTTTQNYGSPTQE